MPLEQRKPITQLARDLGISHQLASHYASVVPSSDPVAEAAAHLRASLPRIVKMVMQGIEKDMRERRKLSRDDLRLLREAAKAGNTKALALLREQEGGPSRG